MSDVKAGPKMRAGTVEMVPVEWIMQHATYSVDGYNSTDLDESGNNIYSVDYEGMVRGKATDSGFGDLVGTILTNGFRVPIVMVKNYKSPWGGFIPKAQTSLVHGNGHHRMAAAILLCIDEIPVYWSKGDQYMCSDKSDSECVDEETAWQGLEWELDEMFYG